jgi:hypothetical protein
MFVSTGAKGTDKAECHVPRDAIVPPWMICRRLQWCFWISSSISTRPGSAAVILS